MTIGKNVAYGWLVPAVLVGALCGPAIAESKGPGPDWMPQEQVVQKLAAAGYTGLTKLKADDGHWEGKAIKDGRIVEVKVDPHSGAVSEENDDD